MAKHHMPSAQGLYDPHLEKDSCGIGFVADLKNRRSHDILRMGLAILCNVTHRGAVGADPRAGDGVGILTQIPHRFLAKQVPKITHMKNQYGVAMVYFPGGDSQIMQTCKDVFARHAQQADLDIISWRPVPTRGDVLGDSIKDSKPTIAQAILTPKTTINSDTLERRLFQLRKRTENAIDAVAGMEDFHIASCSCRTLVYKGIIMADVFDTFFPDLKDKDFDTAITLVHQRFSTNTFPSWALAQPLRYLCHNGEINTLRGNLGWMRARGNSLVETLADNHDDHILPIIPDNLSDSACLDHALDVMLAGGYSLSHAMLTLIPEAWNHNSHMPKNHKAFYRYHRLLMEPWDGPAAVAFSDGRQIGAILDRNGLRPARYLVTKDHRLVLASEMGVLDIKEEDIQRKWRLQPGKILLADLERGQIIEDVDVKDGLATAQDWQALEKKSLIPIHSLKRPANPTPSSPDCNTLEHLKIAFGYSKEDLRFYLEPMAKTGVEPTGSMGTDTPLSVLSDKPKLLYTYFKQCFAQVTNPAIDPIREELVMDLTSIIGPQQPLFDIEAVLPTRIEAPHPILSRCEMAALISAKTSKDIHCPTQVFSTCWQGNMAKALDRLCQQCAKAAVEDTAIIILSDHSTDQNNPAIPALLALSAVHHHLVNHGLRTQVGLVVESGEAREPHHFALLAGYGAQAVHPWLALTIVRNIGGKNGADEAEENYLQALAKALRKIMSKIGISTYQSYCGSQIFDAVGLDKNFIDQYFSGTYSRIGGANLEQIQGETLKRHSKAWQPDNVIEAGGEYAFRLGGEAHVWNPDTVSNLQHAVRTNTQDKYDAFAQELNQQNQRLLTLRGLMEIETDVKSLDISEVEPAADIVKRFVTGAMSFGSISREAHTTLAIAMNRIGGKSNTGEGGEEVDRFQRMDNGDSMRSAIKQVASGRFGVTVEYLVNADDIQIKIAQGAKPGEGGQLPGHKVDEVIAKVRHSTSGVGLISPPPHHDIYSIEDLAQLIFDLKNVNSNARISVKLVSETGVGTVAAGVAKARADHITIAGYDGGTGASPLTSIKHAGLPWEIGLAETQQTLVINRLRDRISVQVDGGLRTGRDVIIGALLGADEFGFSTAPLIAAGCIMMRKCHLNTCPVGIATQNPVLRKRFTGTPEHVINYFFFVAEEVRKILATMGYRRLQDIIGQGQLLKTRTAINHWKAHNIDLSPIFHTPPLAKGDKRYHVRNQIHPIDNILDRRILAQASSALKQKTPLRLSTTIKNTDRSFGAMLSGDIAKRYGLKGLPEDCLNIHLTGSAGQSFGAFLAHGVSLYLEGEANDYVGKGLSGGQITITPSKDSTLQAHDNMIIGNTVLYGAISGCCYFHGIAGERFAVRNSGAIAVVESVGDHGCEYMTGGLVAVLGKTGRNFAAGMSGGVAYILDEKGDFTGRCNQEMVDLLPLPSKRPDDSNIDGNWLAGPDALLHDPRNRDDWRLHNLIRRYHAMTQSYKAAAILADWEHYRTLFIKVMPRDYRHALDQSFPLAHTA